MIVAVLLLGGIAALLLMGRLGRTRAPSSTRPRREPKQSRAGESQAAQVGFVTGMLGGSIEDAAVADYALRRVGEEAEEPPAARELGFTVGLRQATQPERKDP